MSEKLQGVEKAEAIKRTVARAVSGGWRLAECKRDAAAWLGKAEGARRKDVDDYCDGEYQAAGLDAYGRKRVGR